MPKKLTKKSEKSPKKQIRDRKCDHVNSILLGCDVCYPDIEAPKLRKVEGIKDGYCKSCGVLRYKCWCAEHIDILQKQRFWGKGLMESASEIMDKKEKEALEEMYKINHDMMTWRMWQGAPKESINWQLLALLIGTLLVITLK